MVPDSAPRTEQASAELRELVQAPGFDAAWLEYCRLYLATPEAQTQRFGAPLSGISLVPASSRLLAIAAADAGDGELAADWQRTRIDSPAVLGPVDEAAFVSASDAAQYGLAAFQGLALIGQWLPDQNEPVTS
jgi:hypothetical protein